MIEMNAPSFDALALTQMASGHVCLNLSENIQWETFPDFAEQVLKAVDGHVKGKCDAADIRLWNVEIHGCALRFVFDDYPTMVSMESSDAEGDSMLKRLYREFSDASL